MSFFNPSLDFFLQIRKKKIMGHDPKSLGGLNPSVGTDWEAIWPAGGLMNYPSAAIQLSISSSSVNDTSAGTGAQTAKVKGLDAEFNEIEEEVTLNGQTAVTTTNSYYRVNSLYTLTAGSSGHNEGDLYAGEGSLTAGVPATPYWVVQAETNRSGTASYTVPTGKALYMMNLELSNTNSSSISCFKFIKRSNGGLWMSSNIFSCSDARRKELRSAPGFSEGTDLQFAAKTESGTNTCSIYVETILVDVRSG